MKRLVTALIIGFQAGAAVGSDWPSWRGPEQTGMSREKAVVTSWSPSGENLVWKAPLDSRTTPVLLRGRLFAICPSGSGPSLRERVIALDADTGKQVWEYLFNVFDTDVVENRLGWSSVAVDPETGNVYAHASSGEFLCLSFDGKLLWKLSLTETFGRISGYGGRLSGPIIDEDRVILSLLNSSWGDQGKPMHRFLALDKRTGEVVWWSSPGTVPYDTCYAVPVVAVIDGVRLLITTAGDGNVHAIKARTGDPGWTFKLSRRGLNSSVVVDGRRVYAMHSEENLDSTVLGRVVCIDGTGSGDITKTGELWRAEGVEAGYASPAVANGRLYVVENSANLRCFDAQSGKQYWSYSLGRVGKGSPTVTADGVIYVGEQNGVFHILKDEGDKCVSLDREAFAGPNDTIDEIFGSPIVADGRVYFMTRYNTYCLGVKGAKPEPAEVPPQPKETKQTRDASGRLQIIPAEITVAPGESVRLNASVYNFEGTKSEPVEAEYSLPPALGTLTGSVFAASPSAGFATGVIQASWRELRGTVRVRIAPKIPFTETFDGLAVDSVPQGWLDVGNKCKVVERDGGKVLQKLATNPAPPFMRVRTYMGMPIAGGYTIEADLLGTPRGERFKPDMGLVNTRYFVMLMGNDQTLRIETWSAVPRIRHEIPFAWKTDTWYRMKLRVDVEESQSKIRAKVWPRGDAEPSAWSIEYTDPFPHREGTPALFAYSPGTTVKSKGPEVFFDNVTVRPND